MNSETRLFLDKGFRDLLQNDFVSKIEKGTNDSWKHDITSEVIDGSMDLLKCPYPTFLVNKDGNVLMDRSSYLYVDSLNNIVPNPNNVILTCRTYKLPIHLECRQTTKFSKEKEVTDFLLDMIRKWLKSNHYTYVFIINVIRHDVPLYPDYVFNRANVIARVAKFTGVASGLMESLETK